MTSSPVRDGEFLLIQALSDLDQALVLSLAQGMPVDLAHVLGSVEDMALEAARIVAEGNKTIGCSLLSMGRTTLSMKCKRRGKWLGEKRKKGA